MFRRIAVHLDNGIDCRRRVEFALQMARPHDAHLTGIFASYMLPRYFYDEGGMWVRALDLVKELNTGTHGSAGGVQRSHGAGRRGCVLAPGEDMPAECVVRHARHSDVLILGQENAGDVEAATGNDFAEQVLLSAGRPVIVLPTAGSFRNAGARVLYCWNQSRESARAIADAAPLLRGASARALTLATGPGRSGSAGFLRRPGRLLPATAFPSWSRSSATHERPASETPS